MTAKSHKRGHEIYYDKTSGTWRYVKEDISILLFNKRCVRCEKLPAKDHDACLGDLAGVTDACCGHGVKEPYFVLENGERTNSIERVREYQEKII